MRAGKPSEALKSYQTCCRTSGATPDQQLEASAEETLGAASVTIAEALLLRKIIGPPDTVIAETRRHIANMVKQGICVEALQPGLWRQAQAAIRAGR